MNKISYRIVYNRKNHLNAEGKALLQIEAYLKGKRIYFSTNIYLTPKQWDDKRKVIKFHASAESLNYYLKEFIMKLESRELELWKQGYEVTLSMLKDCSLKDEKSSFLKFVEKEIEKSSSRESTKNNKMSTLKILANFRNNLRFDELTTQLLYDFESYLHKNEYNINTIAKHMKHLRLFVNSAIDKGYMDIKNYPFRRYKIKMKESRHTFLLPEELQKMEELTVPVGHSDAEHVLDAFLFCCYTGMRYSDFINLSSQNFVSINSNPWIVFNSVKTGVETKLPLHMLFNGKALRILQKYRHDMNVFFQLKSNSKTNKELEYICKLVGIEKHVSFHVARHTNATLLLYKGTPITTVQKLLGHRNISTTQVYTEVLNATIVKDLGKCM